MSNTYTGQSAGAYGESLFSFYDMLWSKYAFLDAILVGMLSSQVTFAVAIITLEIISKFVPAISVLLAVNLSFEAMEVLLDQQSLTSPIRDAKLETVSGLFGLDGQKPPERLIAHDLFPIRSIS